MDNANCQNGHSELNPICHQIKPVNSSQWECAERNEVRGKNAYGKMCYQMDAKINTTYTTLVDKSIKLPIKAKKIHEVLLTKNFAIFM